VDPTAQKIRIDPAELADPRVDAALAQQGSFGMRPPDRLPDRKASLLYRPWLVLAVAGALGGLAGWAVIEPFFDDGLRIEGRVERVAPDPLGGPLTDLRISGVTVRARTGYTRVLRGGVPIDVEALEGATRVAVWCVQSSMPAGMPPFAYRIEALPGAAPEGEVSLAAARLRSLLVALALFPVSAAFVGLFLAAADGLLSRAWRRAALCGLVGLSSGLGLGLMTTVLGEMVYRLGQGAAVRLGEPGGGTSAAAFLAQMVARGLAWAVTGAAMGLGQGIALRSRKMALNGLLGGVIGALVGGMLFDPIDRLLHGDAIAGAEASRAVGIAVVGLGAGLMVGVVELLSRDAWLKMLAGPLAGKEFVLFKNPTVIGSSPKSDVYLFKDAEVAPTHALLHALGGGHEIEAAAGAGPTLLNGLPVRRARLEPGDQIRIGKTVLSFGVKESA
jgi:hypothetical protein